MADAEGADKQHSASARQRTRFAEKGESVRSRDLLSATVLWAAAVTLLYTGRASAEILIRSMRGGMMSIGRAPDGNLLGVLGGHYYQVVLPVCFSTVLAGVLGTVLQNRGKIPWRDLEFDLSRVNPIPRLGQLFSFGTTGISILQNLGKIAILGSMMFITLKKRLPLLILRPPLSLRGGAHEAGVILWEVMVRGLLTLVVLGLIDYAIAFFRLERRMKMSTQQLREEAKEDSGDPQVRGRRKKMMRELLRSVSVKDVPKADVVLVNPTHYAVAILYKSGAMSAPRVVAKGKDALAARIRAIARKHGVAIVSQPPLTRLLYKQVRVGRSVPADLYQAVAVVLAHVYRTKRRAG